MAFLRTFLPVGTPLIEDQEFRKIRLKSRSIKEFQIDLDSVYSFSQNTNNIDFVQWCLVGVPMLKSVDMRSIFGNCPARLLSYEVPDSLLPTVGEKHAAAVLNYMFNVQCARVSAADAERLIDIAVESDDEDEEEIDLPVVQSPAIPQSVLESEEDTANHSDNDEQLSSSVTSRRSSKRFGKLFGSEDQHLAKSMGEEEEGSRAQSGVGRWFRTQGVRLINPDAVEVEETEAIQPVDVYMETDGDLRYCPACIETIDHRKEGRRKILFLIPWAAFSTSKDAPVVPPLNSLEPRLRSYADFCKKFPIVPIPRLYKNRKLSAHEKQRRAVVESYRSLLNNTESTDRALVTSFLSKLNADDIKFMNDVPVSHVGKGVFSKSVEKWEGSCCLAMDRRHFTEGVLVLTQGELLLLRSRDSKKSILKLDTTSVIGVRAMRPEETPFQGFKYFLVETFGRVYYFMVRSERQLATWIAAFHSILPPEVASLDDVGSPRNGEKRLRNVSLYNESANTYYTKTPHWRLEKRRILNFRSIIFTSEGLPERLRDSSPCELVESILEKAFIISEESSDTVQEWISFMNDVSTLQTIDIFDLSETAKAALYLNLYHTMVLHGILIFGPPASWASWPSFFNSVTYILAFDIVSIAELEHNILRYSFYHYPLCLLY